MIANIDFYCSAKLFVDIRGANVPIQAALKADKNSRYVYQVSRTMKLNKVSLAL